MAPERMTKVAAVQAAPIIFNLEGCLAKAATLATQARDQDCDLIVFGEAWFPGYPFQIWLGAPAWFMQYTVPYFDNSMEVGSAPFETLCNIARDSHIMISAGFSERDGGSLYLSQVLIDKNGDVLSVRRKLKPTHVERAIFGEGYGQDLAVTQTDIGNVGQLCCWEHMQPLSRFSLYSQNEQIHVAAWPSFVVYRENAFALGVEVNMAATRTYAVEGQCFAIAATSVMNQETLDYFKVGTETPPFITLGGGSSMIFGPDGRELADYLPETEEGLVVAELDMDAIKMAKAIADPTGHYSKPESTRLVLNRSALKAVVVEDEMEEEAASTDRFSVLPEVAE
ncbi:MAG: carbon-nitrogen hydrolase family protein [Gammaproteobacteria bacterium]|nr:carbon-nitrogen hydrolase family protein [Gammaproteobacteria bacterium]